MSLYSIAIDDPRRGSELKEIIKNKSFLHHWYLEVYAKYKNALGKAPKNGLAIEIGAGGGFSKEILPDLITTDIVPYPGLDAVIDATCLPYEKNSVSIIFANNVFHHIPDVQKFLNEVERVLLPGGILWMLEPYWGWLSRYIYKSLPEGCDENAKAWKFSSQGPLSSANIALPYLVFERDKEIFKQNFPELELKSYAPHSPFRYWISGGLKNWSLAPGWSFKFFSAVDRFLSVLFPKLSSFVDIEIQKRNPC